MLRGFTEIISILRQVELKCTTMQTILSDILNGAKGLELNSDNLGVLSNAEQKLQCVLVAYSLVAIGIQCQREKHPKAVVQKYSSLYEMVRTAPSNRSPLTPHPSPLTPHPSPLTPHHTWSSKFIF